MSEKTEIKVSELQNFGWHDDILTDINEVRTCATYKLTDSVFHRSRSFLTYCDASNTIQLFYCSFILFHFILNLLYMC